ncbi:uncharacterized protein LOC116258963 isoform X3 [Nymphaea colorata]|uniref:uncharacterized protein LOC116258963 isoform X3 n=1 Tax=Nymphaea colorata TaxID=210225 RepID=UPI00214DFA8B|nr:uncharacterized protein LOC116258963 isoform X3 [Nymphaea colorata]
MGPVLLFSSSGSPVVSSARKKDEVYVTTVPLRATKGPVQWLMSAAYRLNLWEMKHYMVVIRPSSSTQSQALVFDFQPQDPEDIFVALAALSGRQVPGISRVRSILAVPKSRSWYVGFSKGNAVELAHRFNKSWEEELQLGRHDCRHYTNGWQDRNARLVSTWTRPILSPVLSINIQPILSKFLLGQRSSPFFYESA